MEAFNSPNTITIPYSYNLTTNTIISSNVGPTTETSSIILDNRIWSNLPQPLLDRVVAFLPPPAFFRFRRVCKRWYGLLYSPTFLDLYLSLSPRQRHCFLFFRLTNASTVDSSSSSAAAASAAFLFDPYDLTWHKLSSNISTLLGTSFSPASSSGGLVCYVSTQPGPKSLFLCNPITGSLAQLPPAPTSRLLPSVGMAVSPTSIDVTVAGDDMISPYAVKNLTSENFHIDAGGFYSVWGATSAALPRLSSFESSRIVHVAGRFYTMNYSPFSVLAQDISTNAWWKIQAPMRRFLRSPSLVEGRGGRLVLAAAVEKSQLNVPKSFRMWALQPCGTAWAETERMPQQLYSQFDELEAGKGFSCVGHGQFVVVLIRRSERPLLFDAARKLWLWMPPCPYTSSAAGDLHAFAYEPRLAAPVTALLDHLSPISFQSYSG